jgi:hypothetical protein
MSKKPLFCVVLLFVGIAFTACQKGNPSLFVAAPLNNHIQWGQEKIRIDTIRLDSIDHSSYGETFIQSGRIAFVDKNFCTISYFDTNGKHLSTKLGSGG